MLSYTVSKATHLSAQFQAMFARGWSYPTVLKAKSDQKIADLRRKTAGGLSSSTLLGLLYSREQCRNIQKTHAAVDMHVKTETGRTKARCLPGHSAVLEEQRNPQLQLAGCHSVAAEALSAESLALAT